VQRDHSDERPDDPQQEFDYDSEYYGFGFLGEALFGRAECARGFASAVFRRVIVERGASSAWAQPTIKIPSVVRV